MRFTHSPHDPWTIRVQYTRVLVETLIDDLFFRWAFGRREDFLTIAVQIERKERSRLQAFVLGHAPELRQASDRIRCRLRCGERTNPEKLYFDTPQ